MNSIEQMRSARPVIFWPPDALRTAISPASGATLPRSSQQVTSRQVQVGQSRGHEQSVRVLRQAAVANFGKTEDAFDDADGMLDLGPDARLGAILGPIF